MLAKFWTLIVFGTIALGQPLLGVEDYPVFPNEDAGADATVSAEDGGRGFGKLAAAAGWTTNVDFEPIGDPRATKGGELIQGTSDYPSNFRPAGPQANTAYNYLARDLMFESMLTLHTNTVEFCPSLATHWKKSSDGQTFSFRLNPNAKWADGSPITSADVRQTWRFLTDESLGSPSTFEVYSGFEEPVAVSKYIVEITCNKSHWLNFLRVSGMTIFPAQVLGKYDGKASEWVKDYNTKYMLTSGPYVGHPKDQKKGERLSLRRRSDYWAADCRLNAGRYNFDRISHVVVADQKIAFERLKKGEQRDLNLLLVNTARRWVVDMRPQNIETMARGLIQKRKIFNENPQGPYGLAINMRRKPYDDIRVRKALTLLFPRKRLLKELMYNQYLPLRSYYAGGDYENRANPKNNYNPREALKLLAEAGWKTRNSAGLLVDGDGKPFTTKLLFGSPGLEKHLTMYQESLRQAGITLTLELTRPQQAWQQMMERKFDLVVIAWSASLFPQPDTSWKGSLAHKPNTNNLAGVDDEKVNELLTTYENLTIEQYDERCKTLQALDHRLAALYPYIQFWYGPYQRVIYWNVFGHPASGLTRVGDYDDITTTWWFDAKRAATVAAGRADTEITMPVGKTTIKYWREKREAAEQAKQKASNEG